MPRELLKRALAYIDYRKKGSSYFAKEVISELAKPEDDTSPIAYANVVEGVVYSLSQHPEDQLNWQNKTPLYAHPPRKQEPLRDEDILGAFASIKGKFQSDYMIKVGRAIERAHGIGGEK